MQPDAGTDAPDRPPWHRAWPAALAWAVGWAAMVALDGALDLANLALLLVLASTFAALWLPGWLSALASAAAVLAFNWSFVPPRHQLTVDLRQHTLLLATMLAVNWTIASLVIRQRGLAARAQRLAEREARLRSWADTLRDAADPAAHASALHRVLAEAAGVPVAVAVLTRLGDAPDAAGTLHVGEADGDRRAGLALCIRDGRPLGPGTGRYEEQPDSYLPLRGRGVTLGAAVLCGLGAAPRGDDGERRAHLQALCDQLGGALQRALLDREERRVREAAQGESLRNAMLAAVSHDYRTPLATILGAASSLAEQAGRHDPQQRQRLAEVIVDEAQRLSRLTDNTLQLARLGAPGVVLRCDWESAEEIAGAVVRRARRRPDGARLRVRLEPDLPLLWCDALLVHQLLDNLVDNALKYSPAGTPVELLVRRAGSELLLAVRDRGPGVPPAARERVFEVFARGDGAAPGAGAGVGLAVCRAIAQAHGGTLRLRPRGHGGAAFECRLPLREPPSGPAGWETA